jgi:hypothetical protein
MSKARHICANCQKEGKDNKLCTKCHVAAYCCKQCQTEDWQKHKRYCKRWVYSKFKNLQSFTAAEYHADAENSDIFRTALEAAKARGEEMMVLMTPIAAEKFIKTLYDDYLPSCEAEERIWGLWGGISEQPYQRLLTAYQKAFKYGDLTATKLMEALCARPHASKALTDLLHNTKMVCTETDSLEMNHYVVDRYMELIDGLQVVSEFDQWPIREGAGAAAGAAASASGSSSGSRR